MALEVNIQKLDKALDDFHCALGVSVSILDADYSPLGSRKSNNPYCLLMQGNKKGSLKCINSNRQLLETCKSLSKPVIKICYAGLAEMAVPMLNDEKIIGYVMLGHVKVAEKDFSDEDLSNLPIDLDEARAIYSKLTPFFSEKISAIVNLTEMFVKYIISEECISPIRDLELSAIKKYILDNSHKKISVEEICRGVHISRGTLYNILKKRQGLTVSEYINLIKVGKAKTMLKNSELGVEEISEKLAFGSCAYFCKIFKTVTGYSPLKYRQRESDPKKFD